MIHGEEIKYVKEQLSTRALLEGLAEEGAEMSQAALKLIRAIDGENPTPVSFAEACRKLAEEAGDVLAYLHLLDIGVPHLLVRDNPKWERWAERIKKERERRR